MVILDTAAKDLKLAMRRIISARLGLFLKDKSQLEMRITW
jgi:hypothetical protein